MAMTFAEEIEKAAAGEAIEAIVVGHNEDMPTPAMGTVVAGKEWTTPAFPEQFYNARLSWDVVRSYLTYQHEGGFGLADCHPVYAWTASWVIVVGEYDGSTNVIRIPRHPIPVMAEFV